MTYRIDFLPEVEVEVEAVHDWYEARRPGLGLQFLLVLEAALKRAEATPAAFPIVARRTRRAVLRRFPYHVFFVVEEGVLLVTALLHAHRDPARWTDRIREPAGATYKAGADREPMSLAR